MLTHACPRMHACTSTDTNARTHGFMEERPRWSGRGAVPSVRERKREMERERERERGWKDRRGTAAEFQVEEPKQEDSITPAQPARAADRKRGHLCYQTHTICNHMPPLNCCLHQHIKGLMTIGNESNILGNYAFYGWDFEKRLNLEPGGNYRSLARGPLASIQGCLTFLV